MYREREAEECVYISLFIYLYIEREKEPVVTNANTPPGMFSPVVMPVDDLGPHENPLVHLVDMIPDYQGEIDRAAFTKEYKAWFKDKDRIYGIIVGPARKVGGISRSP